jgi:hypothetical protein
VQILGFEPGFSQEVEMAEAPQARDLEAILARLDQGWQELAELLRSQAQVRSQVVAAQKFVLVEAGGEPRGTLEVKEDGSCGLVLLDETGRYRAWLGLKKDGSAYLSLKDRFGRICWESPQEPRSTGQVPPAPGGEAESPGVPPGSDGSVALARLEKLVTELAGLRQVLESQGQTADLVQEPGRVAPSPGDEAEVGPGDLVSRRLEKLEHRHRWLQVWGVLVAGLWLAALVGLAFMMHRAPQGSVALTAPALTIHDAGGARRAWLGPRDGGLYLDLLDQEGKIRTTLGLNQDGDPLLQLYDRSHKLRAELALTAAGEPGLSLADQAGWLRVALGSISPRYQVPADILERPLSSLVLFNQDGVPVWRAPLHWRR